MTRRALGLAAWVAFLTVALAALHALGDGPLAAPPTGDEIGAWLADRDAPTVVFALVRLGLLATAWYLLAATALALVLRLANADGAARAVEACTPAPVRRLLRAAAGLSVAASVMAVSGAAASESDAPAPVTMRRLPDASSVTMIRLPDEPPAPPTPTTPAAAAKTWTVAPGDHLWAIAERSLAAAWGEAPTDDEIDPYWRLLVEANRPRLADPTNPDLVQPGLVVDVPPPPARPVRTPR